MAQHPAKKPARGRQKIDFAATTAVALMLASCGRLLATDQSAMLPAQRAARLEHVHRTHSLQEVESATQTILQSLPTHIHDSAERRLEGTVRQLVDAAMQNDIDPYLVAALVVVESYYQTDTISPMGAVGLMQVLPYVAADVALRNNIAWRDDRTLLDPSANLAIGSAYLRELLDEFDGDLVLALAAYNIGPSLLKQRMKTGWRPNGPYVRRIMVVYRDLRRAAADVAHLRRLTDLG